MILLKRLVKIEEHYFCRLNPASVQCENQTCGSGEGVKVLRFIMVPQNRPTQPAPK